MLCSFFFDRCVACCELQYLLTVVQHCSVSRTKNYCAGNLCCNSKVLFEVFSSFLWVLIFVMAILSVNRRVYVSDGDFDCWFGANQVARSPKSPAWNQKSPIWNITLWLTGIIAIAKQRTDRKKKTLVQLDCRLFRRHAWSSVCFILC